jgi:pseudaminic acid synthase
LTRPFIVAELSASHCGSLQRAIKLVEAAHAAGADAVKLQTWREITVSDAVIENGPWAGRTWRALYDECRTPWEWHVPIFERCHALGMVGFSTPFDEDSVAFLERLKVPLYKVASFEITHLELVRRIAATGKPVILSTGMSTVEEIAEAVTAARAAGCAKLTLLKCVSAYPAPLEDFNLVTMADMFKRFRCSVGLSDHSQGSIAAVAAVGMGASIIEKHITLDGEGPDGGFASTPESFASFVRDVRMAEAAFGAARYGPTTSEATSLFYRRSLWLTRDVHAGEELTAENVGVMRPAAGLAPHFRDDVIGRRASRAAPRGTPVLPDLLN